jgi:hypothetical protein
VDENTVEIVDGGQSVRVAFDPATGLPVRMIYDGNVTESFSDWREVEGMRLPFKIVVEQGGQKAADATVSEYKINSGLTAQELGRRP